jgi:hypothetical protein
LSVETVILPLSDWAFQWRDDGWWRELSHAQHEDELSGLFTPSDDEWVRWRGMPYRQARGQSFSSDAPTWWLLYDEMPPDSAVRVQLADGTEPRIHTLHGIWMCEWVSVRQSATVTVGGESWMFQVTPPGDPSRTTP